MLSSSVIDHLRVLSLAVLEVAEFEGAREPESDHAGPASNPLEEAARRILRRREEARKAEGLPEVEVRRETVSCHFLNLDN